MIRSRCTTRLAGALATIAALTFSPGVMAQVGGTPGVRDLSAVQVSARESGPRIWKFVRGQTQILVLGTIHTTSRDVEFSPFALQEALHQSDVVLGSPGVVVGEGVGLLRGLTLWPSIRKTKYLPNGQHLADVVPADVYATWQQLKATYLGKDRSVERMLPMYAAWQLHEAMQEKLKFSDGLQARALVIDIAETRRIARLDARYRMAIKEPRHAVQQFQVPPERDVECFRSTLAAIEDAPAAYPALTDAWRHGDVDGMQAALGSYQFPDYCWAALTNDAIARQQGVALDAQTRAAWSAALRKAIAAGGTIFTTAPVSDVLAESGRIRWLMDEGFRQPAPASDAAPSQR
jgi:uncharacterized protein YbaP (TraB family)